METNESAAKAALRVSSLAASYGFDWETPEDVLDKVQEELEEVRRALQNHDAHEHIVEEIGDLFFALINLNRKLNIASDEAFFKGVQKFERRFNQLQTLAAQNGQNLSELTPLAMESLWNRVKQGEHNAR